MNQPQASFLETSFIKLKDQKWLDRQRIAGKVAANTITLLQNEVINKTTKSLVELDLMAEIFIKSHKDCIPTFKGYKGFPACCCISVNNELVHGIPKEYKLREGDLVSFDLGVTFEGTIADTAVTCIYGQPKLKKDSELVQICQEALYEGIRSIKIGKRLGCIGFAINKYVTSKSNFKIINNYGGHGICTTSDGIGIPHAQPFVANKSRPDEGIRIQPGLVIAIEPLLAIDSNRTHVGIDGWTVFTENNLSSHAEHSVFIHEDYVEIITLRNNEDIKI